ncbi:MAG: alpha/beta hydrolase-fold protein [Bacteroidota bacterium]
MNRLKAFFFIFLFSTQLSAQQKRNPAPFILGQTDTIQSAELKETRTINIYLPEGYSPDSAALYPVIYLLDGSADEDFIHIAGLIQYSNFPWVNFLPRSILVGIANVDRRRDFTFPTSIEKDKKDFPTTGSSAKFIAFIEKELQPFIETHYKTNKSKTIIGQSLGGLLATEILFKKPGLFTNYIIVSPSLWWDNESLLSISPIVLKPVFKQSTTVYLAVGKEGKIMEGDARKLVTILKKRTDRKLQVNLKYFPDEDHATILHLAVYRAFQSLKAKE